MSAERWVERDPPDPPENPRFTIRGETLTIGEHAGRAFAALELHEGHGRAYALAVLREVATAAGGEASHAWGKDLAARGERLH